MALHWLVGIDKGAVLDEAQQLALRCLGPSFAEYRTIYETVDFQITTKCERMRELVAVGRESMNRQTAAQNRFELESKERRDVVEKARGWFDKLHTAGRYARARKHPLGERLPKLMFTGETDLESWRRTMESLGSALENLAMEPVDWKTVGLTPDFLDQGRAVLNSMTGEWSDAIEAETQRYYNTERLTRAIDEIVELFEEISAARDMAMIMTGRELPGLELSLVKAAAAPSGSKDGSGTSGTPAPTGGGATGL